MTVVDSWAPNGQLWQCQVYATALKAFWSVFTYKSSSSLQLSYQEEVFIREGSPKNTSRKPLNGQKIRIIAQATVSSGDEKIYCGPGFCGICNLKLKMPRWS